MSLVSIVISTYRRYSELKRALDSLAKQTYSDIEIVLVDDNADDVWNEKVFAAVGEFRRNNPGIALNLIVNEKNQGSAKTRNIGIEASKGRYVTFLDDDDCYLPEKVSKQVAFMEEYGCDYSVTDLWLYDETDKLFERRVRSYIKDTSASSLEIYHLKYHITGTDTMMFKREYLLSIGGFAPVDVGDEFYLMQRAILGKGKFGYLPGCEVKAYIHTGDGGLSSGDGKIKGENSLYEYKKTFFKKIGLGARRYIRMRHYAVLAFAYYRMKSYLKFFKYGVLSVAVSPFKCLGMLLEAKRGV